MACYSNPTSDRHNKRASVNSSGHQYPAIPSGIRKLVLKPKRFPRFLIQ